MIRRLFQAALAVGVSALLFGSLPAPEARAADDAEQEAARELIVKVHSLRNDTGQLAVALFNRAEGFPEHENAVRGRLVPIRDGRGQVRFKGLKPGVYAVAILHDENSNGKMDTNLIGIPEEGYGFSRDAAVVFGPPSFGDAAFRIVKPVSLVKIKAR